MKKAALAAVIMLCCTSASLGEHFVSGNQLLELCSNNRVAASSYVVGAADTVMAATEAGLVKRTFCLRPGVTSGQLGDIVCQSLGSLSSIRDFSASVLVTVSLAGSFPCQ